MPGEPGGIRLPRCLCVIRVASCAAATTDDNSVHKSPTTTRRLRGEDATSGGLLCSRLLCASLRGRQATSKPSRPLLHPRPAQEMSSLGGLAGELFVYSETKRLVAFRSGVSNKSPPQKVLVLIGGLTDGLMATPYVKPLSEAIGDEWALVQCLLRSSYQGWGTSSLKSGACPVSLHLRLLLYLARLNKPIERCLWNRRRRGGLG